MGVVGQDPLDGFVTDTVEVELAYSMEQLTVPPATMRKRVEETLDLRHHALHELPGGRRQRVAIGSVLTAHPRVLVLDEPTSTLDPTAAEEVLAAATRLVHDLGVTALLGRSASGGPARSRPSSEPPSERIRERATACPPDPRRPAGATMGGAKGSSPAIPLVDTLEALGLPGHRAPHKGWTRPSATA